MPLVLALNINLSHYLIFSHGSLFFSLNKLYGHRKQAPGLMCIFSASSSSISDFYPNSTEVTNWPLCEGQRCLKMCYSAQSMLLKNFESVANLYKLGGFVSESTSLVF